MAGYPIFYGASVCSLLRLNWGLEWAPFKAFSTEDALQSATEALMTKAKVLFLHSPGWMVLFGVVARLLYIVIAHSLFSRRTGTATPLIQSWSYSQYSRSMVRYSIGLSDLLRGVLLQFEGPQKLHLRQSSLATMHRKPKPPHRSAPFPFA
jgi:hypothetical protein